LDNITLGQYGHDILSIQGYQALQERLHRLGQVDRKILRLLGDQVIFEAKYLVPRKTGNLSRSFAKTTTADSVRVAARANYAAYVELGTREHDIHAKPGHVLAWPASAAGRRLSGAVRAGMFKGKKAAAKLGGWAYAMSVHHPGTKPHPYLLPAARIAIERSDLKGVIYEAWDNKA
jgi:hypothetical protein